MPGSAEARCSPSLKLKSTLFSHAEVKGASKSDVELEGKSSEPPRKRERC